jgi:5'-deoxynucleotidase YfbR-like HD superfamily hydrolase
MSSAWLQTYMGYAFDPLDPRAEDVDIRDIAHGLAYQCRFHGHTRVFSSVAQHSVLVASLVEDDLAHTVRVSTIENGPMAWWTPLAALLHDAHEAYLGDMPRPIKRIPEVAAVYKPIEENVQCVIHERFGLPWPLSDRVRAVIHLADNMALAIEKRDQMCRPPREWAPLPEPSERWTLVRPACAEEAEDVFLRTFYRLRSMP